MLDSSEKLVTARLEAEGRGIVVYLLALTGSRDLAEDLFQETCLQVWRVRERYDPARDFGPWVRGIARKVALRHWRRIRRDRLVPLTPEVLDALEPHFEEIAPKDRQELRKQALKACMAELGATQRKALHLFYEDRWTMNRIGQEIGRTSAAAKMLVSRVRKRLGDCVSRRMTREQQHG